MGASLLGLLLVLLAAGFYLYLRSALPQTDGRIVLSGPKAEIRVERDADGVPRIMAQDDEDLAFGLGFVHAQERLFQMEMQRRYGLAVACDPPPAWTAVHRSGVAALARHSPRGRTARTRWRLRPGQPPHEETLVG